MPRNRFFIAFVILVSLLSAGDGQEIKSIQLPLPTGQYAVARRSLFWFDASRSGRAVRVDLWYPANSSLGPNAEYFPNQELLLKNPLTAATIAARGSAVAAILKQGRLRPNAHDNGAVANLGRPFPVLLFSHGLGNSPYDYTIQLEDLASHGYVVAGVEHPGDSLGVALPDGTILPFDEGLWEKYPPSSTEPDTARFYEARGQTSARDLLFVLDRLAELAGTKNSPFYGVLDVDRVGAFGHSSGGRAAATACILDRRVRACLNEDGGLDEGQLQRPYWPLSGQEFHGAFAKVDWFDPGLDQRDFAAMHTSLADYAKSRLKASGAALDAYRSAKGGSYRLTLLQPGMLHTAFTDQRWITANSETNRARYEQYLVVIRSTVRAFFDHTLKGEPTAFLCCDSVSGTVLVQCY